MFEGSPPCGDISAPFSQPMPRFLQLGWKLKSQPVCVLGDGFWILLFELRSQRLARFALWGSAVHIAYVSVFAIFGL